MDIWKKMMALVVCGLLCTGCSTAPAVEPKALAAEEQACFAFVKSHMLVDGGMITNYHKKPPSKELATGAEVLSESQGLLLGYTAAIGDRETFDQAWEFTKTHLDNGKLFAYRYDPSAGAEGAYTVNAAVDDLRIIKGLIRGGEVFSDPGMTRAAKRYADRFYKSNVEDGRLYDFYDSQAYRKNSFITLCYLDLETLGLLATQDQRYQAVYDQGLEILERGYISDEVPLFMTRYDYGKGNYEAPGGINMIEAVLTALHLSYAGKCPETTIEFLRQELGKGKIYASYELDGTPKVSFESTAVYALCALLGQQVGDQALYEKSMGRMKKFMVRSTGDPLYGAFGDDENVYSFDNLMALTALRSGVAE